jgi:hypothetical protein
MNVVGFDDAGRTWNGNSVSLDKLGEYLAYGNTIVPEAFVVLDPSDAPTCREAAELRDFIDKAADCQGAGFCGQGSREAWKNAPGLSGPGWVE